ncbi:MAG TPA: MBL fold metallo-hydrolase [Miltoncostaeaceae bacterium]|nr:MBL fold metallo-hydrolase [Miltoncostaeaceae bacterium]
MTTDGGGEGGLEVVPVGVGSAYARYGEAQSCYLVRAGDCRVCLDMGSGALNRLQVHVAPEDLTAVVVSHLHPDHMIDLLSLKVYLAWGPPAGRVMPVWGPAGLRARLAAHGDDGLDSLRFVPLDDAGGEVPLGEGMTLRYARVPHLDPTFALRVEHGGAALCFSADCRPNEALVDLARGAAVLICECSFGDGPVPDGVPHMSAADAGGIARRAGVGRLLLTHCYPEFDRDAALAAARAAAGDGVAVEWATQDRAVRA